MSKSDLFSGITRIRFSSCVKFSWASHALLAGLVYDPVGWRTSVVSDLRQKKYDAYLRRKNNTPIYRCRYDGWGKLLKLKNWRRAQSS